MDYISRIPAQTMCETDSTSSTSTQQSSAKYKLKVLVSKQIDPNDFTPLNFYEIRNYIYYGFSDSTLRPLYWKILLNYYSENKFKSEMFYRSSRLSYNDLRKGIDPLTQAYAAINTAIDADIHRTGALQTFADDADGQHTPAIKRILTLYASKNPNVGYVQGMIGLLVPIYYVLSHSKDIEESRFAEEDAFFMFNNLMAEVGDNFSPQHDVLPTGLVSRVDHVLKIIQERDPELHSAMVAKGLADVGVPMKWILLLFSGEFPQDALLWLWDRILSDAYRFEMVHYCCAAAIILVRDVILNEPFDKCMAVLQHISIVNQEVMFDIADVMRRSSDDIVKIIENTSTKASRAT